MLNTRQIHGKKGEDLACSFLIDEGYHILKRNYRAGKAEIDIIARIRDILVFIEVRSTSSSRYGFPEQTISKRKEAVILQGAEEYIFQVNWDGRIRFDIIAIELYPSIEIEHMRDVFA